MFLPENTKQAGERYLNVVYANANKGNQGFLFCEKFVQARNTKFTVQREIL